MLYTSIISTLKCINNGHSSTKILNDIDKYTKILKCIYNKCNNDVQKRLIDECHSVFVCIKRQFASDFINTHTIDKTENYSKHLSVSQSHRGSDDSKNIYTAEQCSEFNNASDYSSDSENEDTRRINNIEQLFYSMKIIRVIAMILENLAKITNDMQIRVNSKIQNDIANQLDIYYINRQLYLSCIQCQAILQRKINLFTGCKRQTYLIKIKDDFVPICILDNLDIDEYESKNKKVIRVTIGSNIMQINYIDTHLVNGEFNDELKSNLNNINNAINAITANKNMLQNAITKIQAFACIATIKSKENICV